MAGSGAGGATGLVEAVAGFGTGAKADGGISFIAGLAGASGLAATGRLTGFSTGLSANAGFSAEAGLASSSAIMRRIDARISSIEGSWTFAGCVISDSTSKPNYTK